MILVGMERAWGGHGEERGLFIYIYFGIFVNSV